MARPKNEYEIVQVDAWGGNKIWYYNETFTLCTFESSAMNEKRLFLRKLKELGITFRKGTIRVEGWDEIEIQERKTGRPLFLMRMTELPF